MTVKLRRPAVDPVANGSASALGQPISLKPMAISGVCVTKEALVEALKIYLPTGEGSTRGGRTIGRSPKASAG